MNARRERFEALRAVLAPLVEEVLATGETRVAKTTYLAPWMDLAAVFEDIERGIQAVTWGRPVEGYITCFERYAYVVLRSTR